MALSDLMPVTTADDETLTPKQLKRRKILRAAVEVFAAKGFFTARMTDIAREAEVADGTLYLYFKGKEDLLVSIFDELLDGFVQQLKSDISGIDDPLERLRLLVRRHLGALSSDRALAHIMQIETRHSRRFMSLFSRGRLADYLRVVKSIFVDGQASGQFRSEISPNMATIIIFGAVDELVTSWLLADEPWDMTDEPERLVEILIDGFRPRD